MKAKIIKIEPVKIDINSQQVNVEVLYSDNRLPQGRVHIFTIDGEQYEGMGVPALKDMIQTQAEQYKTMLKQMNTVATKHTTDAFVNIINKEFDV